MGAGGSVGLGFREGFAVGGFACFEGGDLFLNLTAEIDEGVAFFHEGFRGFAGVGGGLAFEFAEAGGFFFEGGELSGEGDEFGSGGFGFEGDFLELGVIDCRGAVGEAEARDEEEGGPEGTWSWGIGEAHGVEGKLP
ncbi:MAG: hypothetical protein DVB22_001946 [Verrucomicrobia bacterium]|nr:MAG: hypothetical protein DVB22_001946 [Verrucomicrobiota bacterium]